MKVLWLCNIMLPVIAEYLNKECSNKEGWLTGLSTQILERQEENKIELGVCFPIAKDEPLLEEKIGNIMAFGFYEDTKNPHRYDKKLEQRFSEIIKAFQPDVIHCFGTEYPHTLSMVRAGEKERILIGIQGLCYVYADFYMADLPVCVQRRFLLRDFLKWDNIRIQQKKFVKRGEMEKEALKECCHVTGRTAWDKKYTTNLNPKVCYHFMNETLRSNFYEDEWTSKGCEQYSIFVSQGDYPIKGLHYLLGAMPRILKEFPTAHIYVAGQSIIKSGLMGKIKISSYGKYLQDLIRRHGLEEHITFLGKLNAQEMKEQYLKSHVFVCPSSIENSPNSLGEAMILGVPCVSARVGGIESIFSEEDGILYPAGDEKALADVIIAIFSDNEKAKTYGQNAKKHAQNTHSREENYQTLIKIYEEISGQA